MPRPIAVHSDGPDSRMLSSSPAFDEMSTRWNGFATSTGTWNRICADIQPNRFYSGQNLPVALRAGGVSNYLYADGHVEGISGSQVKQWADTGFNFSLPPD